MLTVDHFNVRKRTLLARQFKGAPAGAWATPLVPCAAIADIARR
jgi:hypothetical protein